MKALCTHTHNKTFSCVQITSEPVHLNLQIGLSDYIVSEEAEQSNENLVVKKIRSQDI